MKKTRIFLAAALITFAAAGTYALDAKVNSVDTTVVYRRDGEADVTVRTQWLVSDGEMHAFYFEGEQAPLSFDQNRCWADIPEGQRLPLEITRLSDSTYDIVLAGGRGFSGTGYIVLTYRAQLARAGMTGLTQVPENTDGVPAGTYFYFNWSPVEWEYRLASRTTRIVLPVVIPDGISGADSPSGGAVSGENVSAYIAGLGFFTEKYVNSQNSIDWYGTEGEDGNRYLTFRFSQENVPPREHQQIQFYLNTADSSVMSGLGLTEQAVRQAGASVPRSGSSTETRMQSAGSFVWIWAAAILASAGALALFLYHRKLKGFEKASAVLEETAWAGDDWEPPVIAAGSYQVPGKIAEDLHPVEAALLLNLELSDIVSIILDSLTAQAVIEVTRQDPLKIHILTEKPSGDEIAEQFLACFDAEGNLLGGLLADFFENRIKILQEKVWDCDLEATAAYYRKKIADEQAEYERQTAEAERVQGTRPVFIPAYWGYPYGPYWWSYHRYTHRHMMYHVHLPQEFSGTYASFMSSSACFSGCFDVPGGTVNACYSACHNACVSGGAR